MASHGTGTNSNVAHVRPIQIQPATEAETSQLESSSVAKDPFPAFDNIINIAPLEDEDTQEYNTVTVNVNGVTKRVKVPIGRTPASENQTGHVSTSGGVSVTLGSSDGGVRLISSPGDQSLIKTVIAPTVSSRPPQLVTVTSSCSTAQLPVNIMGVSSIQNKTVGALLMSSVGQSAVAAAGKGLSSMAGAPLSLTTKANVTTLKPVAAKQTQNNTASVKMNNGIPGFLGSDGKFYIQVDPTKLQVAAQGEIQKTATKSTPATVRTPGVVQSAVIQQQPARQTNPSYTLNYLNKGIRLKDVGTNLPRPSQQVVVSGTSPLVANVATVATGLPALGVTGSQVSGSRASGISGIRIESAYSLNTDVLSNTQKASRVSVCSTTTQNKDFITYVISGPISTNASAAATSSAGNSVRYTVPNTIATPGSNVVPSGEAGPLVGGTSSPEPLPPSSSISRGNSPATRSSTSPSPSSAGNKPSRRKQYLGVIDISDDESGGSASIPFDSNAGGNVSTNDGSNIPTKSDTIRQILNVNKQPAVSTGNSRLGTEAASGPRHLTIKNDQIGTLISKMASGKYVLVPNKDLSFSPTPAATSRPTTVTTLDPLVKYPRTTARKSFGQHARSAVSDQRVAPENASETGTDQQETEKDEKEDVYEKIRKAHPELKDVRIHVENLDLNLRMKSFNVKKLKTYLINRRQYRKRQSRRWKPGRYLETVTVKTEPIDETEKTSPQESTEVSKNTETEKINVLPTSPNREKPQAIRVPKPPKKQKSRTKPEDHDTPKPKRDKKETVTETEVKVPPSDIHPKTKYLLIKTSQANYLMPVQAGVSSVTFADQISQKTSANVTVMPSAAMNPVSTSIREQLAGSGSTGVNTITYCPAQTVKSEKAPENIPTDQRPDSTPPMSLLKSIMLEATKSQKNASVSEASDSSLPGILTTTSPGRSILKPLSTIQPSSQPSTTSSPPLVSPSVSHTSGTSDPTPKANCMELTSGGTTIKDSESLSASASQAVQKEAPGDRIRKLREKLKEQEAAVELVRQQREKTAKFLENMDD